MSEHYLGPIISGESLKPEIRRRKSKDILKSVTASNKKLIAAKVKLEEEDGWRVVRKNSKSTRMARPKPADEQLEDEVWSALAQMGFTEMSHGRQFTIAVEAGLEPRQMDVFAKDDETAVIVECTQKESPGKKDMSPLIQKLRAIKEPVLKSIEKYYGREAKPKLGMVIATRNIAWTPADLAKCQEAQITVISDGELDYYNSIVQHLKHAARYQFLAHVFGGQKINGLSKQVVATKGKMGNERFYTFLISPEELLKIAYVGHKASRNIENLATYQRMLQPRRLKKISEYINGGGKFPTNVVINLKTARKTGLKFETIEGFKELGKLSLPANYASAWIIDGQHRLYGYAYARAEDGYQRDKTMIPVLAYENLPADKEMNLFIDINSKQVKVSTGLLVELYSDLHWDSSDPEEAFQALLSRIASRLNGDKTSPLYERMVVTGKKKSNFRCLTQPSIRDGLGERAAKLLGTLSKGQIVPGPLSTSQAQDYTANLQKALAVLTDCLDLFKEQLPEHWNLGDGPGGYLCTNNGLRALFHVIKDVSEHIRQADGTDLYLFDANETYLELKPYLQAAIDYFKSASAHEIQAFRRIGSSLTAVRQQAYGIEAHINAKIPAFCPTGLQEYLDSRDEAGTEEAASKVTKVHKRLFDYVISTLKSHYGVNNKAWWTQGIPLKIRQDCTAEWEAKNREGEEESQLYLISYIDICIANWYLVSDVISLDTKDKDNKKANTKWIKDLNEIRKITTHPERGVLSTDQVAFVNDIFEKVERYIPESEVEVLTSG